MQQLNLGDYKGGRENLGNIMAYEMPQHAQMADFSSKLGQLGAQSTMGRQAQTELLGMKLAAQDAMQERAAMAQAGLYERQNADEETKYQRRRQEGLKTYGQQFGERQVEFDRQQQAIESREERDYKRKKDDYDTDANQKRDAFRMEMEGAHKALTDYHEMVLSARRPEDPDYQMSAKFLEGLKGAQGKNAYYIQGILNQHQKNGITPFGLGQLGIASAKPAQRQGAPETKKKLAKPIPKGFHLDDKYNQ
jgi:hypothetical protein